MIVLFGKKTYSLEISNLFNILNYTRRNPTIISTQVVFKLQDRVVDTIGPTIYTKKTDETKNNK